MPIREMLADVSSAATRAVIKKTLFRGRDNSVRELSHGRTAHHDVDRLLQAPEYVVFDVRHAVPLADVRD